uniref:At2g43970/F6E13.10 n=1 Tax=mine drainage metagenome TaxID=410659 RepID=E6QLW1_9ZZZZ
MRTEKDKGLINKSADCADLLSNSLQAMVSADDLLLGEMAAALLNDARVLNNKLERIRYLVTSATEGDAG